MKYFSSLLILCAVASQSFAQNPDTITITPDVVKTSVLKPGVHRYLVYFKKGQDSSRVNFQLWTREIVKTDYHGKPALSVTQEWEDNSSVVHKVRSVSDARTFAPLYHETWWKGRGAARFEFPEQRAYMNDALLTAEDTVKARKSAYDAFHAALKDEYILNWHLDLEVFPILPYQENRTFVINFYDPGFGAPKDQEYTVSGSGMLEGFDNQKIDCWILEHKSPGNKELFWISKKTKEVLKLEQEFRGQYRYKIKLGFSK